MIDAKIRAFISASKIRFSVTIRAENNRSKYVCLWHLASFAAPQYLGRYWTNSGQRWLLARDSLSANDPERTSQLRRRKTVLLLRLYMRGRYRSPHHSRKYRKAQRETGSFSWIHPSRNWPNAIGSVKFLLEPAEMLLQGADG